MTNEANVLMDIRTIIKVYEEMLKRICGKYDLTMMEANVISFLHNNPGKDTAGDIVELRMLSKSAVSQAVEALIQKSLLRREQDAADRRKIHLFLLPQTMPITGEIAVIREQFRERVFLGFSDEDRALFDELNRRIVKNARIALGMEKRHE